MPIKQTQILNQSNQVIVSCLPPHPTPPLLILTERIALNRKCIACPMIDVIGNEDFHYESQAGDVMRGAFDWELYYKRIPINAEEMKRRQFATDPVRLVGFNKQDLMYGALEVPSDMLRS